jgi:3-phenylpropionate/trans-cinnamate dioxygenase ferredoxin reductase component
MSEDIVIIGAGQAGASAAIRLRKNGFSGAIVLIGNEGHIPYQKPPLSKKYLVGIHPVESLYIRPAEFWQKNDVRVLVDGHVDSLDLGQKSLRIGGEQVSWGKLILATGSRARPMPDMFRGRENTFELRTIQDVERFAPHLQPGKRLVVVGGGFIGLETAAVARQSGLDVTVIERAPRILERAVCHTIASHIRALHNANGVRIIEGREVLDAGAGAAIGEIVLDDLERIPADLVLVGIGVVAQDDLARNAGITTQNGVVVDDRGRTSAPNVWAAGDCTAFSFRGETVRLENVQNAIEQSETVADDICGRSVSYAPVPWFWSDQYDSKLQITGLAHGYDDVIVRHGGQGGVSCWYFTGKTLTAVAAVDDARAYMTAKRMLERGANADKDRLSDPATDLRELLAA